MREQIPINEVLDLIQEVSNVYYFVDLVEGDNEIIVPTTIAEATELLKDLDDRCMIYVNYDREDKSLYLGRSTGGIA